MLLIGSAAHHDKGLQLENLHAVAAGIQNLLLGATAAGLASFWATPALHDSKRARQVAGFDPDVYLMAVVYLGWPTSPLTTPGDLASS